MAKDLIDKLLERMEQEHLKLPQLAKALNIPYPRLFKWSQKKSYPKVEDAITIQNWLDGKLEQSSLEIKEPETSYGVSQQTKEYIQSLKDQIELLKSHCSYVEKQLQANLDLAVKNQGVMMAQIRAASRMAAMRHAGNNPKKLEQELHMLDKLVGEFVD